MNIMRINNKKGISPLIATVLIIGFVIGLVAIISILMGWNTDTTEEKYCYCDNSDIDDKGGLHLDNYLSDDDIDNRIIPLSKHICSGLFSEHKEQWNLCVGYIVYKETGVCIGYEKCDKSGV